MEGKTTSIVEKGLGTGDWKNDNVAEARCYVVDKDKLILTYT